MDKRGLLIVVLIVVSIIGISYSQLFPNLAPRPAFSKCITPPAFPQMIIQSGTICPGTYYDGIEIAGNNINLKCAGATFAGYSNPNRMNGLLINGSYRNITVEDCIFSVFPENGISLSGPVGVANPQKLTGVLLKNITAFGNGEDGLRIKENTYQIDALGGKYYSNGKNGVHLVSEYKDPLRYNINPDLYPKYFPNDVRLFNATMSNNGESGVHVDAEKYYRQLDNIERESNILIIDGNLIKDNVENGVKNTDFFSGFFQNGLYFVRGNDILNNSLAGIKIHTKKTQGPNGNEINCTPVSGANLSGQILANSEIDYIYLNRIEGNKNGVELTIDSNSTPNSANSCGGSAPRYDVYSPRVYANRIRYNHESGVLYQIKDPFPISGNNSDFFTELQGFYKQNIISFNGNSGVFLNGSTSNTYVSCVTSNRYSSVILLCNDIVNNRDYGVRVTGRDNLLLKENTISLILSEFNILEGNTIGGIYLNYSIINFYQTFNSYNSYVGLHPVFGIYNGVTFNISPVSISNYNIFQNDFASSPLLAFDVSSTLNWNRNWWSDYSPGCVNVNPFDLWCDVARPIPVANQDVQPKAGSPWGNNARGYLQLDQGILLSQCYVEIPQYPNRPTNPGGGGGGNRTEPGLSDG